MNTAVQLDGIIQCGDLGFFPDPSRLDRATKKFARKAPEELGFAEYFRIPAPAQQDELLERTLSGGPGPLETVRCNVVFCHGNHEEFQLLETLTCGAKSVSVDIFNKLHFPRSGETVDVSGIRVGAVGRAPENEVSQDEILGPTVSKRAVNRLRKTGI